MHHMHHVQIGHTVYPGFAATRGAPSLRQLCATALGALDEIERKLAHEQGTAGPVPWLLKLAQGLGPALCISDRNRFPSPKFPFHAIHNLTNEWHGAELTTMAEIRGNIRAMLEFMRTTAKAGRHHKRNLERCRDLTAKWHRILLAGSAKR